MNSRTQTRRIPEVEPRIDYVQCDGLVVMKMVKHCHEESMSNMDVAQGALLGLVVQNRLEITNCFPFPKNDEIMDEEEYQLAMMRQSQYHYQTSIEESVVLIYDTAKSARGFLTLKAYRLTPQAIQMYKEGEFTPEALRTLKIGYENLFIEIPVVIKNSNLTNIMMSELEEMIPEEEGTKYLDLGTATVLENQLRCLMDRVDELNQEAMKFNRYQQLVVRQQLEKNRLIAKREQENSARSAKNEPPLPDDDINKLMRPLPVPPRLNPMIVAGQINTYSEHISQFCAQSLAKLYITQSLQNAKESKSSH
ncbi:Eukaryotic translation initiation factor 3 subunit H [Eufriesea mexicana]|uniref:Eukaryotic translation initiation factor 3 subunit H n=1 Tax=Eufriesea mexicana TaxID=516756 RepID=A0A310SR26_9HYME|nr:Eukaryotic translation initiation factor 3 subunit H [Eufriesea mexicana]